MGRSGLGAARLLRARGLEVTLLESRDDPDLRRQAMGLRQEGIEVRLGVPLSADACLADPARPPHGVVVSPGIRWDHPVLEELRRRGVGVQGEMVPAWESCNGVPWIGITGTNGKTTVTHLVHHLLAVAGLDAPLCGNVGFSAAELALERMAAAADPPDWLVVELSSYQIEAAPQIAPAIGVWTTLTPDHLERHGTLDNYRAIKRLLLENSTVRILNADDPDLRSHASSWDRADWVSAGPAEALPAAVEPFLWIEAGMVTGRRGALFPADCLAMPGEHNRQNLVMAAAVALHAGVEPAVMERGFRSFPGVPHRLERIREHRGVAYFNDSKATNYDAAEVALRAMSGPAVVLAGGRAKVGDAGAWLAELGRSAPAVVLFGEAAEPFAAMLAGSGYGGTVRTTRSLEEAVPLAAELAGTTGSPNVLLSPACASFDQYTDFEARGDHFRRLVLDL